MSERYYFDDGGVWSGDPNEAPVRANPPCVHDKQTGDEFDCTNWDRLPELAAALNAAEQAAREREQDTREYTGMLMRIRSLLDKHVTPTQTHPDYFRDMLILECLIADGEAALQTEVDRG